VTKHEQMRSLKARCRQLYTVHFFNSQIVYVYMYVLIYRNATARRSWRQVSRCALGIYTILSLPIVYRVWHIKEGSGGVLILRKCRAMALQ